MLANKNKEAFLNCFADLQRAATAFYRQPQGQTHQVFLKHALKILAPFKDQKTQGRIKELILLKEKTALPVNNRQEAIRLADKILTLGCVLKA